MLASHHFLLTRLLLSYLLFSSSSTILQRWKRALHVPLRLDVYYQHPDARRELLERWCLEYAPKSGGGGVFHQDPIVQLRHVCKQIVIWLRSLYCISRMMPAQKLRAPQNNKHQNNNNNNIGFSIYVVSEGNDDVSSLLTNQGFASQGQPHSVLTPYGELGWRVFYAPKPMIQRLVPEFPAYPSCSSRKAISQPIPMKQQQQQQHAPASPNTPQQIMAHTHTDQNYPFQQHLLQRRDSTPAPLTVQSAPSQRRMMYHRSHSDVVPHHYEEPIQKISNNNPIPMRSNSGVPSFIREQHNTSTDDGNPPRKNLSALSLAMMQSDEDANNNKDIPPAQHEATTTDEAAEKRRAALHHAPPQFSPHTQSPIMSPIMKRSLASATGEYGYGYNNHIPNLHRNPSNSSNHSNHNFNDMTRHSLSMSPSPLATTPPGTGFLYGGPTPPSVVPSNLIPPRSAVTPPFVRPMGFVGEPPSQPLPPPAESSQTTAATPMSMLQQHTTSLDLLHSSPFQQPPHGLSPFNNKNSVASHFMPQSGEHQPLGFHHPFAMSHDLPTSIDPRYNLDEYEEDMPFAVDSDVAASSTTTDASAVVASFASTKRLALFDSTSEPQNNDIDSLAVQLAEFKTFGASLMVGSSTNY